MNPKLLVVKILLLSALVLSAGASFAYMQDIEIIDKKEIVKLTNDQLIDTYVDVYVEMEASKAFHATSGFNPKSYTEYKDLLRYRVQLLMEIHKRGLEAPILDK